MRSLFTILLAAALAIPAPRAQAQNASDLTLKGRTVNDKGAVVDYATVSVSSVQDSTKTYGTVGDDKGAFEVRLPRGDYRLKISFMGYENLERQIELNSDTDLGDLTMHPSAVTLDEVVVTGNIITREADRFIVNLANTPLAIGRDGKEIMSLAPGVWISEKGEISVNGRKGTRVMVNDRLLRETGEDLLAYLQNLKAEDILKIEVIPYAGAEYDADMTSGIIKITLKKQRNDGMEGSATMRYGHSLVNDMTWYLQPAVNLKYRNNKLSLYTDFSLNRNKSGNTVSGINQFHTGDQVTQTSGGKLYNLGSYKTLRVGGVYDIDDRQSVGLEVNYTHSPSTGNNRNDLTMQSGDRRPKPLPERQPQLPDQRFGQLHPQSRHARLDVQTAAGLQPPQRGRPFGLPQPLFGFPKPRLDLSQRYHYAQQYLLGHSRFRHRPEQSIETHHRHQIHEQRDG